MPLCKNVALTPPSRSSCKSNQGDRGGGGDNPPGLQKGNFRTDYNSLGEVTLPYIQEFHAFDILKIGLLGEKFQAYLI
jgi:hypothetical protein